MKGHTLGQLDKKKERETPHTMKGHTLGQLDKKRRETDLNKCIAVTTLSSYHTQDDLMHTYTYYEYEMI